MRITGVPRGQRVTLRARRTIPVSRIINSKNVTDTVVVASSATFDGNASGNIDVDYSTPIDGSWTPADELGLFWSMRRVNALGHDELKRERAAIDLVLESRGVQVARGSLRLRPSASLPTLLVAYSSFVRSGSLDALVTALVTGLPSHSRVTATTISAP